ncbi:hypothetical protein AB0L99_24445 [Streptomyces sp. NPDC051954]|uniref:hypothetical protein n=1 Tax=Streptomyces sp. NPDC051954 TaxID=3155524 RepID=UPI003432BF40
MAWYAAMLSSLVPAGLAATAVIAVWKRTSPSSTRFADSRKRAVTTWAGFLHSQADALPACDFFETIALSGTRLYVSAVLEHGGRRIRILGATAHPTTSWVTQAAKNLVMDLDEAGCRARFLIRDRDGTFPALFGTSRSSTTGNAGTLPWEC